MDVAHRIGRIIKNQLDVFERGENLLPKWYDTLCILDQSIVRNRSSKL